VKNSTHEYTGRIENSTLIISGFSHPLPTIITTQKNKISVLHNNKNWKQNDLNQQSPDSRVRNPAYADLCSLQRQRQRRII
jgi:hypothetical protein